MRSAINYRCGGDRGVEAFPAPAVESCGLGGEWPPQLENFSGEKLINSTLQVNTYSEADAPKGSALEFRSE